MRYILFAYVTYYPAGGANDIIERFRSMDDARNYIVANKPGIAQFLSHGIVEIYDIETGEAYLYEDSRV